MLKECSSEELDEFIITYVLMNSADSLDWNQKLRPTADIFFLQ